MVLKLKSNKGQLAMKPDTKRLISPPMHQIATKCSAVNAAWDNWISVLLRGGITVEQVNEHIPFLGALLKNEQDTEAMTRFDEAGGNMPKAWSDLGPRYNQ